MTATPEDAATWRDLTVQLTAEQVADLEREERNGASAGSLRYGARVYAQGKRKVGEVTVVIRGRQYADGSTERELNLSRGDDFLDAAGARHLAAALIAAAEHMERLDSAIAPGNG